MKILFLTSGPQVPSTRFRVMQFLPGLRAAGHRCTLAHSFPEKYGHFGALGWRLSQRLKRATRRWHLARARLVPYDVVWIERELFNEDDSRMEERFRKVAPLLVLDVDDGVFLKFPAKFDCLCGLSDLVFAGNRFLQQYIQPRNANVVVVPTCVDAEAYRPRPATAPAARPVVGWIGTTGNLQYLAVAAPALSRLAARLDFELRLIASDDGPIANLPLDGVRVRFVRWDSRTDIDEVRQFDIGIMPLRMDQEWDKYKCGLKLLQYMAAGIPAVASPVGVNGEIVAHGENGFLASNVDQWQAGLQSLLESESLRRRIGSAARLRAEADYSVQAWLPRIVDCLQTNLDARRRT
ncbi:MAG: glycosyltransferase family 4 protein [Thermoguttaceae bacterium]